MSLNSLVDIAVQRRVPAVPAPVLGRPTKRPAPVAIPAGGADSETDQEEPTPVTAASFADLIPTEVLVGYTSVLGVLAGALAAGTSDDAYLPLRVALLVGGVACVGVSLWVAYVVRTRTKKVTKPWLELVAGCTAFVLWGLVAPGSVLYATLDAPGLPVAVGVITAAGYFVATAVFRPLLGRPAASPEERS